MGKFPLSENQLSLERGREEVGCLQKERERDSGGRQKEMRCFNPVFIENASSFLPFAINVHGRDDFL
jgi:hypothetical protein